MENSTDIEQIERGQIEHGQIEHGTIVAQIAKELKLANKQVEMAVALMDEGNTIPFIARYRKEATGELDETALRDIEERLQYLRHLATRKEEVLRLIAEQGKLTEQLQSDILKAVKLQEVEDLYRPYRQKRKTRASVAKERGLEPLAEWILSQPQEGSLEAEAAQYVSEEREVADVAAAVQSAMDIIAEMISDDARVRAWVRQHTYNYGVIRSEARDSEEQTVYDMYYDYEEPIRRLPPHRILAMNRGEKEEVLRISVNVETDAIFFYIAKQYDVRPSLVEDVLHEVIADAYKRLIAPSIEREVRASLTEQAEEQAINVFAENLRQLLLQPPVKGKVVLGVDPAFRTGCKLAVVDETGKLLEVAVTYPTPPLARIAEAEAKFIELIERYDIELIVIGNGTASRETEQFVAQLIQKIGDKRQLQYIIVSEAGASVYSASKIAQTEFPDLDVAERSAVSIARRLQDPLAELVKIDPQAIGVGQYQHDVSQKRLAESLQIVVESVVNHVGVDLNTASPSLLSYVSGINQTLARNIVAYREEHGKFTDRAQLKQVPRLGAKSYEQCVGFLRISDGDNPLDNTPIHPESYAVVDKLFRVIDFEVEQLRAASSGRSGIAVLQEKLRSLDEHTLAPQLDVGVPTLRDIIESLQRPGRDPRDEMPAPIFHTDILKIEHLKPGMELQGTVRNVIDFGAFVDIGIENDGLVHISELSDRYVKHPLDVVAVGDIVTVWIKSVDEKRGRISLTMRKP